MRQHVNSYSLFFALGLCAFAGLGQAAFAASCPATRGVADLKETRDGGWGTQYWINGFPGVNPRCRYTLALCYSGKGQEKGATVFIVTANGAKYKSQDHIRNCKSGWTFYFRGAVAGAREILLATEQGITVKVGFVGEPAR